MRVLLTANAAYAPPKGGSTRSNLVWLEHLAHAKHACRVVCPPADSAAPGFRVESNGIDIHAIHDLSRGAGVLREHIEEFQPDWVLVSSEDVAHVLLREAAVHAADRLVYLAHTPQWYPFGPASWHNDPKATAIVRSARARVAIGETTASYIEKWCGAPADVVHPPIYGEPPWPRFGSFTEGYVLMINPCVVKGISIFLALARRFPEVQFAGLAGWGTTQTDRDAMKALSNVTVLETVPNIDEALSKARLLLMPSLWFEGFGLIAMEALLRGLPVISSDSGGLAEANQGTGFVIPVKPVQRFEAVFDENHMPRPVTVEQDIPPWENALRLLLTDRALYESECERSRMAAEQFVSRLRASDFEDLLYRLPQRAAELDPDNSTPAVDRLTPAQKALLLRKLKERNAG